MPDDRIGPLVQPPLDKEFSPAVVANHRFPDMKQKFSPKTIPGLKQITNI
jgi:hypothetical protein